MILINKFHSHITCFFTRVLSLRYPRYLQSKPYTHTHTHTHTRIHTLTTQYRSGSTSLIFFQPKHPRSSTAIVRTVCSLNVFGRTSVCIPSKKNFRDSCVHRACVSLNFLTVYRSDRLSVRRKDRGRPWRKRRRRHETKETFVGD